MRAGRLSNTGCVHAEPQYSLAPSPGQHDSADTVQICAVQQSLDEAALCCFPCWLLVNVQVLCTCLVWRGHASLAGPDDTCPEAQMWPVTFDL